MRFFFKFLIRFAYKCGKKIYDASTWLKERYPNVHLGVVGLSLIILPFTAFMLIANQLTLLGTAINYFGFDSSLIWSLQTHFLFSPMWVGWPLFAIKATGFMFVVLAIYRAVLLKRPEHGYLALSRPLQSTLKENDEPIQGEGGGAS